MWFPVLQHFSLRNQHRISPNSDSGLLSTREQCCTCTKPHCPLWNPFLISIWHVLCLCCMKLGICWRMGCSNISREIWIQTPRTQVQFYRSIIWLLNLVAGINTYVISAACLHDTWGWLFARYFFFNCCFKNLWLQNSLANTKGILSPFCQE